MERLSKNIFSLGFSRIISGVVSFVVVIWLSRYLGPSEFGKFSLVVTYYTIFLLLVDLGISRYVIQKVSEDKSLAQHYVGNFFIAQSFISLLVLGLFFIIPRVLHYGAPVTEAMLLAGLGLLFLSLSIPFSSIIQAWQRIHLVAAINFANTMIYAIWLAVGIILKTSLVFLFWSYIIYGLLDVAVYFFLVRGLAKPHLSFQKDVFKKMFIYGIPFAFISGFEILVSKVDVIIQKFYLPFHAVGLYATAYRFLDALTFVPAVVAIALFPVLSEKADLHTADIKTALNRLNRYMLVLALPVGVGTSVLADKIILTLFRAEYLGSALPLRILIWASSLTLFYAVPNVIMIVKKTRQAVWTLILVTIFNVVTNIVFIPKYGIVASAWITVLSYILAAAIYIYYTRVLADYELLSHAVRPAAAAAVMGGALWLLRAQNLGVLILLAIVVYFGGLFLARFFKRDDWEFLRSIFHKQPVV